MLEIYKTRPILAWSVTAVAGLILVWAIWPRGSSSTGVSATVAGGASPDAQLNADTAIAMANIQANASLRQSDNERAIQEASLGVTAMLGQLGYDVEDRNAERNFVLQNTAVASNERIVLAQGENDLEAFGIQTLAQLEATRIEAANQLSRDELGLRQMAIFAQLTASPRHLDNVLPTILTTPIGGGNPTINPRG